MSEVNKGNIEYPGLKRKTVLDNPQALTAKD
jgi:hypothetical protein